MTTELENLMKQNIILKYFIDVKLSLNIITASNESHCKDNDKMFSWNILTQSKFQTIKRSVHSKFNCINVKFIYGRFLFCWP